MRRRASVRPLAEPLERRLCLTTLYVAPYGSDVFPGTLGSPLGSLAAAAAKAEPGDVIYLRAGTYTPAATQLVACNGVADAPIAIEAYPGETVLIDGASTPAGGPLVQLAGSYVSFENIELRDARGAAMVVTGQNDSVVDNTFDAAQYQGIVVGSGSAFDQTANVTVQGNYIFNDDLAFSAGGAPADAGPRAAAATDGATSVNFTSNYIHDNAGVGLDLLLLRGGTVATNTIHDNSAAEVQIDNASNLLVEQNFIYNTSEAQFYTNGLAADSIELQNGAYTLSNPLLDVQIQNNICLFGGTNLLYSAQSSGSSGVDPSGMKGCVIANNDFYGAGAVNVEIDASPGSNGNTVADNIFDQPTGGTQALIGGPGGGSSALAGFTFEYNDWYDGDASPAAKDGAGPAAGKGDVYGDPLFAQPGSIDPAAYKPQSDSPVVNAAIAVTGVIDDYYGIPRPQGKAPDIGAHELVLGVAPPPVNQPGKAVAPGVPTGFTHSATATQIQLNWVDQTPSVIAFDVQRRANGQWVTLDYTDSVATDPYGQQPVTGSFTDLAVKPKHKYVYRVLAFFSNNTISAPSASVSVTTPAVPKAPKPVKTKKVAKSAAVH